MKLSTLALAAAASLTAAFVPGVRGEDPWEGDVPTEEEIKQLLPEEAGDNANAVSPVGGGFGGGGTTPICGFDCTCDTSDTSKPDCRDEGYEDCKCDDRRRLLNTPNCLPFTASTATQDRNLVSCMTTKEDISTTCRDNIYDVFLSANDDGQSHLFLIAMMKEEVENGADNNNCPPAILLDHTREGEKKVIALLEDKIDEVKELPRHFLGEASLVDILVAEESVEAIEPSNYDYFYNSCAHYALYILRSLGLKETKELGDFVIDNVINDVKGMKIAKKSKGRSLRTLAAFAIGGKGGYENYLKDVVYSQLNLV